MLTASQVYTYTRRILDAYAAVMQPLSAELDMAQNAVDILLFLANNPGLDTARDIYTQGMVPKVPFNHRRVPMNMPEEIWITDTSLRDGQQAVEPYTVDQIVRLYQLMSKLGGPYGIIRQTEMFVYSKKDREALEKCQALHEQFVAQMSAGLAPDALETFQHCLTAFAQNLDRMANREES